MDALNLSPLTYFRKTACVFAAGFSLSQWKGKVGSRSTDMLVETFSQSHPRIPAACEARTVDKPERGCWFVQPLPGHDHLSVVPFPLDTRDQQAFFVALLGLICQMDGANGALETRRLSALKRTKREPEASVTSVTACHVSIFDTPSAAARVLVGILCAVGVAALCY